MAEYIERGALIKEISESTEPFNTGSVLRAINRQSAADVAPVVHGQWEGYSHSRYCGIDDFGDPIYRDGVVYYCSECRRKTVIKEKYCPNCGARMDL